MVGLGLATCLILYGLEPQQPKPCPCCTVAFTHLRLVFDIKSSNLKREDWVCCRHSLSCLTKEFDALRHKKGNRRESVG